jgi:hypothetical protein
MQSLIGGRFSESTDANSIEIDDFTSPAQTSAGASGDAVVQITLRDNVRDPVFAYIWPLLQATVFPKRTVERFHGSTLIGTCSFTDSQFHSISISGMTATVAFGGGAYSCALDPKSSTGSTTYALAP